MNKLLDIAISFVVGLLIGIVVGFKSDKDIPEIYVCYVDDGFYVLSPEGYNNMEGNKKELCYEAKEVK